MTDLSIIVGGTAEIYDEIEWRRRSVTFTKEV
jgi:hypothetical protein